MCGCIERQGVKALLLPADMPALQPTGFEYVRTFARKHELKLLENRRLRNVKPAFERRSSGPAEHAAGLAVLIEQAGITQSATVMSRPHQLEKNKRSIALGDLIASVSGTLGSSVHRVVTPTGLAGVSLGNGLNSIACYTSNQKSPSGVVQLSHFVSRDFRCVGYSAGNQFVLHQFIGGGSMDLPSLWVSRNRLANSEFRLQLFQCALSDRILGLFYRTVYLSLADIAPSELASSAQLRNLDTHKKEQMLL